jgi:hypothetical protein
MTVVTLDALLSATGQELLGELALRAPDALEPPEALALATKLRARFPAALVAAALSQHALRLRARAKWARAGRMWFTREGLEQASGEAFARHRAARYAAAGCRRIIDLCSGIGGDLAQLAVGRAAIAADLDPVHSRLAVLNAAVYGATDVQAVRADVRTLRLERAGSAAAFADPARRDPATGRRFAPGTAEPSLAWCLALAGRLPSGMVAIKAAPGLPLDLVPAGWEAEFVATGRELREAVLWSPALATTTRRATILPPGHTPTVAATLTLTGDGGPPVPCAPPGAWLLDPNPAVTRAGLVETLARQTGAWKLDQKIAFLSAEQPLDTPFGRLLAVDAALPWSLKRLRAALRARRVGTVDLRRRGSPIDVDDLRHRLDLHGDRRAVVVLTRVANRPWALICHDPRR